MPKDSKYACKGYPQYEVTLTFKKIEPNLIGLRRELSWFIKEALECWGEQRNPDDWLFDSLEEVVVKKIERIK